MGVQRKLAALVGVDLVGYSAMSERNEAAAVEAVAALRAAVALCEKAHGGRAFNRAGDGIMLEFPSAMNAVRFCLHLLRRLRKGPAVRIGAHLGEVRAQDDGDLLGHGVNVTARLCAMAEPRTVLMSDTIRAPLPERVKRLFPSQGPVQLDKMAETIAVYGMAGRIGILGRLRLSRRRPWRIGMIAGGLAVLAGVVWLNLPKSPATPLVAVLRFEAADGAADTQTVAAGLADDIIMSLAETPGLRVAARGSSFFFSGPEKRDAARRLGAAYVLDGVVRLQANTLEVSAQLSQNGRAVVWADEFAAPLGDARGMQQDIARAVTAHILGVRGVGQSMLTMTSALEAVPSQAMSLYYEGREARLRRSTADLEHAIEVLSQAVAIAPSFARAWAELAGAQLILGDRLANTATVSGSRAARLRVSAGESADRALALDANNAYALAVRAGLEPPDAWGARLAWLDRAVTAAPNDAAVLRARARVLSSLGYLRAARMDLEAARGLDPLDPQLLLIWTLEALGEGQQARALLAQARSSPNPTVWNSRVLFALFDRDFAAVDALLSAAVVPSDVDADTVARFRATAEGLRSVVARPTALATWRQAAAKEPALLDDAVLMMAVLGDTEGAFGLAQTLGPEAGSAAVFAADLAAVPAAAALVRDPRYLQLMTHNGLTQYWRAEGRWPDFCADPAWTYRCPAAADAALATL
ncbi:MAG: hypothetical protein ACOYKM_07060 [Caulobacterales bacterium]